jgi:FkbM family methyltransferase
VAGKALSNVQLGIFTASLACLFEKGIRYSTVIDAGSADAYFYVYHSYLAMFAGAVGVNIDPNPVYEDSLRKVREIMGGHYLIAAVGDQAGEVEMTMAIHPYWSSLRPEGDPYWERINRQHTGKTKVPVVTLDALAASFDLAPPFLLKLDVQGAESQALRGAREVLSHTHVVICEADLDDFQPIHGILSDCGFDLFDLTQINWLPDRSLGWFHPVYLNRRLNGIRRRSFWDERKNPQILKMQVDRRQAILTQNAFMLSELRARRNQR